jgi:hypothetical protein
MGPAIDAGAFERALVEAKAEPADQVERNARGSAEPGNVPGVGRDLGFPEGKME